MGKRTRRSEREWKQIIDEHGQSGQSVKAYCERKAIGVASFYQWRRRFRDSKSLKKPSKGAFIEMGQIQSPGSASDASSWTITLDLGDGLKLVLQRG